MWHWKTDRYEAEVELVNGLYRWQVFNRWMGQQGRLVQGPLVVEGYCATLEAAKAEVFAFI
jgi:hypothetical protein